MRKKDARFRRSFLVVANTAMIDVIFILLAFFLSVSQIKKSTVKVELPEVSEAVATGEKEEETPVRRILQISTEGTLYLGNDRMDSVDEFFATFDREVAEDRSAGRSTVVEIITDKEARTGVLVDIINYLTKKKVKRLEFLAVEKKTGSAD
jgi:biopolymer transport protein ExbD